MTDSVELTRINGRRQGRVPVLAILLLLGACSPAQSPEPPTPEPVVAAERAFAADGYERGIKPAFTAFAAAEAIMFAPGPVNAHEFFAGQPDVAQDPAGPHLVWWPVMAGISSSGDLGFTTGPYAIDEARRGHYFTVWQKQPDGSWKWVLDAGVETDPSAAPPAGSDVTFLPVSGESSNSPEAAMAEIAAAEPAYAADARVHTEGLLPGLDEPGRAAALAGRPQGLVVTPRGGGASVAGDLAWTWAEAGAPDGGQGYLVRVWQKRAEGWQIVFDEYVPLSGPAPAPESEIGPDAE